MLATHQQNGCVIIKHWRTSGYYELNLIYLSYNYVLNWVILDFSAFWK